MNKFIRWSILLTAFVAFPLTTTAGKTDLRDFLNTLKEEQSVNVHIVSDDMIMVSWGASSPRRVDKKTVSILQMIGEYSQQTTGLDVSLAVFSDDKSTRLSTQALKNTEYKARRIADALLKKIGTGTQVSSIGMGTEIPYNLIFATLQLNKSDLVPSVVAVPVKVK